MRNKIIALLFILGLATMAYGAVRTIPLHFGDGLTSVTVKASIANGTGIALPDSIVFESFPEDTTITVQDTADVTLEYGYLYVGETDTLWTPPEYIAKSATSIVSGTGSYAVSFVVLDTSGIDELVSGVVINVVNMSGAPQGTPQTTGANGLGSFNLEDSIGVYMTSTPHYTFEYDTIYVTTDTVDTIFGYNTTVSAPGNSDLCTVYGDVFQFIGDSVSYATVTFRTVGDIYDTCGTKSLLPKIYHTETLASGRYTIDLLKSKCMSTGADTKYKVQIEANGVKSREYEFSIPADSSTYHLVF